MSTAYECAFCSELVTPGFPYCSKCDHKFRGLFGENWKLEEWAKVCITSHYDLLRAETTEARIIEKMNSSIIDENTNSPESTRALLECATSVITAHQTAFAQYMLRNDRHDANIITLHSQGYGGKRILRILTEQNQGTAPISLATIQRRLREIKAA